MGLYLYTCSPVQELPHSISQGSETRLAGAMTHRDWHHLTPWTQGVRGERRPGFVLAGSLVIKQPGELLVKLMMTLGTVTSPVDPGSRPFIALWWGCHPKL